MKSALSPGKSLWRRFLLLIPLVIILVAASRLYIHSVGNTYQAWSSRIYDARALASSAVIVDAPAVLEVESIGQAKDGRAIVTFRSIHDGKASATLVVPGNANDAPVDTWTFVVEDGTILENGLNFTGWKSIHLSLCVFLGVLSALFGSVFVQLWRNSWYDYELVAASGGLLFSIFQFVLFTWLWVSGDMGSSIVNFLVSVCFMTEWFVNLSVFPMALLATLVSLSNIVLIQREGMRPVNVLGIAVSVVWALANFLWLVAGNAIWRTIESVAVFTAVDSLIATAMAFGESLLFATIICGWLASRHVPEHAVDYLVVLGCGIRKDGTPSPLLAGRIDKALSFDEGRRALGDAPTTFVPSGGQGPDEIMSEAQSMANYLVSKGVKAHRIVLEDRSTSTSENMALSRKVIERHAGCDVSDVSVSFSTTNYHVFRGYVCAHQAGMRVEGMGSKTRAYFWPNAFLREFLGLLANQWMTIVQLYLIIAILYGIAEYVLLLA